MDRRKLIASGIVTGIAAFAAARVAAQPSDDRGGGNASPPEER